MFTCLIAQIGIKTQQKCVTESTVEDFALSVFLFLCWQTRKKTRLTAEVISDHYLEIKPTFEKTKMKNNKLNKQVEMISSLVDLIFFSSGS